MLRIALMLSVFAGWLAGCQSRAASNSPTVIEQWQGLSGGGEAAGTHLLRSTAEWQAFWRQVDKPVPRPLDSARELAVVVALGQRRTAGYRAEIVGSYPAGDAWVIEYREHKPEPGMMLAQMITEPWAVTIVPRTDRSVTARRLEDSSAPRSEK